MASIVSILMYPQFVQELWHYHFFNAVLFWDILKMIGAWIGLALGMQCARYSSSKDAFGNTLFALFFFVTCFALCPWDTIPKTNQLAFILAIYMYETGFQMRRFIKKMSNEVALEDLRKIGDVNILHEIGQLVMLFRMSTALLIIAGALITLDIAAHIGHLL